MVERGGPVRLRSPCREAVLSALGGSRKHRKGSVAGRVPGHRSRGVARWGRSVLVGEMNAAIRSGYGAQPLVLGAIFLGHVREYVHDHPGFGDRAKRQTGRSLMDEALSSSRCWVASARGWLGRGWRPGQRNDTAPAHASPHPGTRKPSRPVGRSRPCLRAPGPPRLRLPGPADRGDLRARGCDAQPSGTWSPTWQPGTVDVRCRSSTTSAADWESPL